ncbi:oxygenase MpaB family protein [Lacisediminihabitans sp. FW035]
MAAKILGLVDIGAEAVLLAGGGRAILLQLANPAVGHAVADHSDFAAEPLRRLRNTLTYVYALVFGTPHQVAAVTAMVQRAHAPVRSATYDASDAGLQLWVAATLYETAATLHERVFGPLDEASAERVYQDYANVGTALGMPAALWPADREAFGRYWREQLAGLEVDDRVRSVAIQVLRPASGPLWMRAVMPVARLATAGLLPPALREAYALPWDARRQRRFDRLMGVTTRVFPRLPTRLRHWPKNHLLRRLG